MLKRMPIVRLPHCSMKCVDATISLEQDLTNIGVSIEQFEKMTMRQRLDVNLPKRLAQRLDAPSTQIKTEFQSNALSDVKEYS